MSEPARLEGCEPTGAAPVCVFAPCWRCGTTLVQRLLNSSGKILVYGEDHYLLNLISTTHDLLARRRVFRSSLKVFLDGNTETWSNAVLPNPDAYARRALEALDVQLGLHEAWSAEYGFDRWGWKSPLEKTEAVGALLELVPRARVVFVCRDPIAVAMSARARGFARDAHDLRSLARQWSRNMTTFLESKLAERDNVLSVRYEALVGDHGRQVARLEEFCAIEGIRKEVFARRINAPIGSTQYGDFPTGYVEPVALTPEERQIIVEEAAAAMRRLEYPLDR